MSIFSKLMVKDTHIRRYDSIVPTTIEMDCKATGNIHPYNTDSNKEWALQLKIVQTFWANDVQRSGALRYAEQAMAHELYHDVLMHLPQLLLCITSGDKHGALMAVDRIEKATKP